MLDYLLPMALIASTAFTILLLCLPSQYNGELAASNGRKSKLSVQVLVLGDIGRSPRMQYHAMSIAKHGGRVSLIGYNESLLYTELTTSPNVSVHALSPPPTILGKLQKAGVPFIIVGPLKVLYQILNLLLTLAYRTPPSTYLLVQNPPAVPVLAIAILICVLRNTKLIIDWHNYGYTILAGTKGKNHPLVTVSRVYEQLLGRYSALNFTVTDAMRKQLQAEPFSIKSPIMTLHDRPASAFQPLTSPLARQYFLESLPETSLFARSILSNSTRLLVSSTSWTPDEDFSLLLSALVDYSKILKSTYVEGDGGEKIGMLPDLVVLVTGKGPDKAKYIAQIGTLSEEGKLDGITVRTPWLSMEDYAMLLACADLGVCLHKSSSGVDLPMKVVDMLGAGLPVVGYADYESWGELVREGDNGMGFDNAEELTELLKMLFGPSGEAALSILRQGAVREGSRRWDDEWDGVAGRVLGLCE